jgi:hypothetical protein
MVTVRVKERTVAYAAALGAAVAVALKTLVAAFGNPLHTHLSGSALRQEGAPVDLLDFL